MEPAVSRRGAEDMKGPLGKYWRLYLLTVVLGIGGSFQYGIQVSVVTSPAVYIQSFMNYTWMWRNSSPIEESTNQLIWSFIVAILSLGAWAGAIHSGSLSVTYGRKKALLINNVVAIVAALLMLFSRMAKSFEMILLGRFLYGYNVGLGLNVHLMYLGESSPKELRGFLTLTSSIFIAFGKVIGQIIGIKEVMGTEDMWPYLLAVSGIPAILQFVTLPFFPEAPRYLYIDKGDTEGSKKALQWLWQEDAPKLELDDMQKEQESTQGEKAKTVKEVMTSRCVRWQLLAMVIPCSGVQFCGINALYFYAFDIFRESGVPKNQMHYLAIGIGATELITITLCDKLGQFCFLIFVAYSILSATFLIYFIPETKGKTMVEIMEDFNRLNFKNTKVDIEASAPAMESKL